MGSSKRQSAMNDSKKPGCPVPLPSGCLKGLPLPETFHDGVKMKCSNAACKHQEQLIHLECFHALEDNLIKIMSNIGSARGWTETQRRSNLWDKKGLTLIQKKCRCPCGLGLMSLDENAMFLAQKSFATAAGIHVKSKKGKNKNLPKLNFGSGLTVSSSTGKHISRREKLVYYHCSSLIICASNKKRSNFRSDSNNSSRSAASTLTTDYSYDRRHVIRGFCPVKQGTSPAWKDDFEFPVLVDEKPRFSSPFVISSKKADTSLSYAAATSSKPNNENTLEKKMKAHRVTSTPLSSRSMERKTNQTLVFSDFTVDSSSNSASFTDENLQDNRFLREVFTPESQPENDDYGDCPSNSLYPSLGKYGSDSGQYVDSGLEVDVSVIMPSPSISSPSEQDYGSTHQNASLMGSTENVDQIGRYDLFSGPSFLLGELLIADFHLPGAF